MGKEKAMHRRIFRSVLLALAAALAVAPVSIEDPGVALAQPSLSISLQPISKSVAVPDFCDSCLEELPYALWPHSAAKNVFGQKELRREISAILRRTPWDAYVYFRKIVTGFAPTEYGAGKVNQNALDTVYIKPKPEDKVEIREMWAQALGIDIWYPYFKVKEVEQKIKKKISFKIFKMKCKPRFQKGSFVYVCKKTF